MAIQANADGVVSGRFTVPANIPAGTKSVIANGTGGSRGETQYTGSGTITTQFLRRVITITRGFDPLAQTFTLDSARQVAGVELYFTKLGTTPVRVQIRETQNRFAQSGSIGRIKPGCQSNHPQRCNPLRISAGLS